MKAVDQDGRTCLAYARAAASIAMAKSHQSSNNSVNVDMSVAAAQSLVELLLSYGCQEMGCCSNSTPGTGTLPRRRGSSQTAAVVPQFEKLPSSVI